MNDPCFSTGLSTYPQIKQVNGRGYGSNHPDQNENRRFDPSCPVSPDVERTCVFLSEQSGFSTVFPDRKTAWHKARKGISTNPQPLRRRRRVFILFICLRRWEACHYEDRCAKTGTDEISGNRPESSSFQNNHEYSLLHPDRCDSGYHSFYCQ